MADSMMTEMTRRGSADSTSAEMTRYGSDSSDVPQFIGGGPTVLVRNTFIDFEDTEKANSYLRSRTAPAAVMDELTQDFSDDSKEDEEEQEESEECIEDEPEDRVIEELDCAKQEQVHQPDCQHAPRRPLLRQDSQEAAQHWAWGGHFVMPMMVPVMTPIWAPGIAPVATVPVPLPINAKPAQPVKQPALKRSGASEKTSEFMPAKGPDAHAASTAPSPNRTRAGSSSKTLRHARSSGTGCYRIFWTVDSKKIRGNDKQAVSPSFELDPETPGMVCKLMIYPHVADNCEGGANFQGARGRGTIHLKCEGDEGDAGSAEVSFRLWIGSGPKTMPPRGPVTHDFAHSAVVGLPRGQDVWDFNAAIDRKSKTFVICLEIVPMRTDA